MVVRGLTLPKECHTRNCLPGTVVVHRLCVPHPVSLEDSPGLSLGTGGPRLYNPNGVSTVTEGTQAYPCR